MFGSEEETPTRHEHEEVVGDTFASAYGIPAILSEVVAAILGLRLTLNKLCRCYTRNTRRLLRAWGERSALFQWKLGVRATT
jgi:hypothetical protein